MAMIHNKKIEPNLVTRYICKQNFSKKKTTSFYMFGYILGTHVQKSSHFFLNFDQIWLLKNIKKCLILALFSFNIAFFAMYSQEK
jgi:hypothetical protein